MDAIVEKKAKYEAFLQDGSKAFLDKQYYKAIAVYTDAVALGNDLKLNSMQLCIIKYMICCCLLETDKLENLAEAVMILQSIEQSMKLKFPSIYCALARAHCKLYHFDLALKVLEEGEMILKKNDLLATFYLPGTNKIIEQSLNDKHWIKVREECSVWHQPDAICSSSDCMNITKPYLTPNKNIFFKDPAFNGLITVECNNNDRPCSLTFHPICWKMKKDQLCPIEKLSDKKIIGSECFTPNCMNGNIPCVISAIQVTDQNKIVKASIKELIPTYPKSVHNNSPKPVYENASKGAVKKEKVQMLKTAESGSSSPDQEWFKTMHSQKELEGLGYDNDQILSIKDAMHFVDFSREPYEVAKQKNFLFSFYYEYILNNLVRVCDVYSKFDEIKGNLNLLSGLDILTFLLETNKFEVLSKQISMPIYQAQTEVEKDTKDEYTQCKVSLPTMHKRNNSDDITSLYDELLSDDEYNECLESMSEKESTNNNVQASAQNYQSNHPFGAHSASCSDEAAGGDAPRSLQKETPTHDYNWPHNPATNEKNFSSSKNEPIKKEADHNLREYISELESRFESLVEENNQLKKDLRDRDFTIECYKTEKKEYMEKVKKCEQLCETMMNYQKKYDDLKQCNMNLRTDMNNLIESRKELEEKLASYNDPLKKKIEMLKYFKDEIRILQDCANAEWKDKMETVETALISEIKNKRKLVAKCLEVQYLGNNNEINCYIKECTMALEVLNKLNNWVEKYMNIKQSIDISKWMMRMNHLQRINIDHQSEYSKMLQELHETNSNDDEFMNLSIPIPVIPKTPEPSLVDAVLKALNSCYILHCQTMQNLQAAAMPTAPNSRPYHYNQSCPPPPGFQPSYNQMQMNPMANGYMNAHVTNNIPPTLTLRPYQQHIEHHHPRQVNLQEVIRQNNSSTITRANDVEVKIEYESNDQPANENEKIHLIAQKETNSKVKVENESNEIDEQSEKSYLDINTKIAQMTQIIKELKIDANDFTEKNLSKNEYPQDNTNPWMSNDEKTKNTLGCIQDGESSVACVPIKNETTSNRKIASMESLVKLMKKKYPGAFEIDILEVIEEVRKRHNNTLSGLPVSKIIKESEEFFLSNQRIHVLRYFLNDGTKPFTNETGSKLGSNYSESGGEYYSTSSSCCSQTKSEPGSTQKKTWTALFQEGSKWTSDDEIECIICKNLVHKKNCQTLSCHHSFHSQCVKSWLKSNRSCPICMTPITLDEFPSVRA